MQPWLKKEKLGNIELSESLKVVELKPAIRKLVNSYLDDYAFLGGELPWKDEDLSVLQKCVEGVLGLSDEKLYSIVETGDPDLLRAFVSNKTTGFTKDDIEEICNVITKVVE